MKAKKVLACCLAVMMLMSTVAVSASAYGTEDGKSTSKFFDLEDKWDAQTKEADSTLNSIFTTGVSGDEMTPEELEKTVDAYVAQYVGDGKKIPGCTVSVTNDGETVLSKAYGLADVENNKAMTTNSILEYGGVSKLFVWISAMQLSERSLLNLDTDIRTYLPEDYNINARDGQKITMMDLMNNAAGFDAGYFGIQAETFSSLGEASEKYYDSVQWCNTGENMAYSIYSVNLGAYVVECASGEKFNEYVQKNIFDALDMDSYFFDYSKLGYGVFPEEVSSDKTCAYDSEGKVDWYNSGWLYPSGGIDGTADDLSKVALALMGESSAKLFEKQETLDTLYQHTYETIEGSDIFANAHGFWCSNGNFEGYSHEGSTDGCSARFVFNPETKFSVSIITNYADGGDVTYGLIDILMPKQSEESIVEDELPSVDVVVGDYAKTRGKLHSENKNYGKITIEKIDENTILVNGAEFEQIAPYYFSRKNSTGINRDKKLYFTVKDNKVEKATWFCEDLMPIDRIEIKSNWIQEGKNWFYADADGQRVKGWRNDIPGYEGKWLCFDAQDGSLKTGWQNNIVGWEGQWFYFNEDGVMQTGWQQINNVWYYFNPNSGVMQTKWFLEGNNWYYLNLDGAMQTGWKQNPFDYYGKWFYFNEKGVMQTGWQQLNWSGGRDWFCFNSPTGYMYTNCTTPDGYQVDANGRWIG